MSGNNAFYAQSGGVTAVINASACGVIETARRNSDRIGTVFAGRDGILGALHEDLIDTSQESDEAIAALRHTPAGAFGSCRHKLKGLDENRAEYERLVEVFRAHDIGYFFYNGGGDSQDTAHKVSQIGDELGYPITAIGIPKTVDNDLPLTDTCPGFGSVAKYVGVSIREAGLDVASMASTSTKVFILEVMGRHAGWIAAAGGLAAEQPGDAPHVILFPEIPFEQQHFLERVDAAVREHGYCAVVASEGAQYADGRFLSEAGGRDAFGHAQLGGVAPMLAGMVKEQLGHKYHWAVADYLQRSARHIASATDVEQAYAVGRAAVEFALEGRNAVMPAIRRLSDDPYEWDIACVDLADVANVETGLPRDYITEDGYGITDACRRYLQPLIAGEAYPPYRNGLPDYVRLRNVAVEQRLAPFNP
ncbi:6-phosphofructokinase [Halofilum ochraceum]|uniref:6-phosphofructokinase n=1 Tax=Halofilum ochraceum TaxID=1611323 RepID=UPI000834DC58|nr:6-phosphofructokinase [Halofilum ochraceum]